jgi:hypothetical protein
MLQLEIIVGWLTNLEFPLVVTRKRFVPCFPHFRWIRVFSLFPYVWLDIFLRFSLSHFRWLSYVMKVVLYAGTICLRVCLQTQLQEDLPTGMAECDIWTIFFMFAVCLVTHRYLHAYIFFRNSHTTADTPSKCVPRKWTCTLTYEESTPPKISRCVMWLSNVKRHYSFFSSLCYKYTGHSVTPFVINTFIKGLGHVHNRFGEDGQWIRRSTCRQNLEKQEVSFLFTLDFSGWILALCF